MREKLVFHLLHKLKESQARAGIMETLHGKVETPAFAPVGTLATVKALAPEEMEEMGVQVILANTYHLYLRPGHRTIQELGGLHTFMGWRGTIVTDSGGFQAFSLGASKVDGVGKIAPLFPGPEKAPGWERVPDQGNPPHENEGNTPRQSRRRERSGEEKIPLATVTDEGVTFASHLDGSVHLLTPELSMEIQEHLGADIILALDECTSPLAGYEYTRESLVRTHRWALRSLQAHTTNQALFGIVQGGGYPDLRKDAATYIASLPFDGFAIGGSLGRSKADMHIILDVACPLLPEGAPRHLLGIGEVEDLFEATERGIDLFDCVTPTRYGRTGALLVSPPLGSRSGKFRINIFNSRFTRDPGPVDPSCPCWVCRNFSRAYLRHLFLSEELLAYRLASHHNVSFLVNLVRGIRESILSERFFSLKEKWLGSP